MISLHIDEAHIFKVGEIIHLKVKSCYMQAPGKWRLEVENVTPLPGHEPTGYGCGVCGLIEAAKPDGSLPEGWHPDEADEEGTVMWLCPKCQPEPSSEND